MQRRLGLVLPLALVVVALAAPPAAFGTFPGANGRIVFERSGIFSVESNGSGLRPVIAPNADTPAVSPNGALIAFQRNAGPGYGIWTVNAADGSGARQVTVDPQAVASNDREPAWSPDGSRLAFVRGSDLFVMNANGSGSTNLTSAFASAVSDPEWSPSGTEIAFAAGQQIYAIGAGGTPGPTQLNPTAPGNRSYPSWSPSGAQIAYTRGPPGATGGIWTINRAGGPNEAALLAGASVGEVWELSYSPDGSKIGFVSDVGGPFQEELFTVNSNGTGVARLNVDAFESMDWGKPSPAPAGLAAPVLGKTVNVRAVSGRVTIGVRGGGSGARASQKGVRFVPLTQARQIPVGSFINTRKGKIRLTSARDTKGKTQTGDFSAGLFQVLQSRSKRAKGLTELRLKGSSFKRCTAKRGKRAQAAARRRLSRRTIRRLRSNAKGRFRTRGRHSSATVRGTSWTTTDRCDGTLTKVTRGKVAVRDFRRKKTITLRRGKSYLARARR